MKGENGTVEKSNAVDKQKRNDSRPHKEKPGGTRRNELTRKNVPIVVTTKILSGYIF